MGAPAMPNSEPQSSLMLIVDDEHDIADTTAALLECHGYRVAVAYNSKSAQELVARETSDVVFADIGMPEVDGWTMCTELRVRSDTRIDRGGIGLRSRPA